jgi:hypothetical protein
LTLSSASFSAFLAFIFFNLVPIGSESSTGIAFLVFDFFNVISGSAFDIDGSSSISSATFLIDFAVI